MTLQKQYTFYTLDAIYNRSDLMSARVRTKPGGLLAIDMTWGVSDSLRLIAYNFLTAVILHFNRS